MILENECTGDTLYDTVVSLLENKIELEKMSLAQKSLSKEDSAAKIVDFVLERRNTKRKGKL
jgi:UDP-N-acetylglucosamine:LPS N-acetylglucosamine transferase